MERFKKEEIVKQVKELIDSASSCVVIDYEGVPVSTFVPFRKECAQNNTRLLVVKNTLARIAVKGTSYEGLADSFKGMTAMLFTLGADQVVGAKIVKKFAKQDEHIKIKAGWLDGKVLSKEEVEALADLPSQDELRAKLLATMLAVPQNFVRLLNAVPQNFVQLLSAYKKKLEENA